jgi:hypothetical protein
MRSRAVASAENVLEIRFHHDASGVTLRETTQLPGEPLAGADDGVVRLETGGWSL